MGLKLDLIVDYGNLVRAIKSVVDANRNKLIEQEREKKIKENIKTKEESEEVSETTNRRVTLIRENENAGRKGKKKNDKYRENKPGTIAEEEKIKLGHFWAFKDYKSQESTDIFVINATGSYSRVLRTENTFGDATIQKTNLVNATGLTWDEFGGDSITAPIVTTPNLQVQFDEITSYYVDIDTCETICPRERWQAGYLTSSTPLIVNEAADNFAIPVDGKTFILITAEKYTYWQANTTYTGGRRMFGASCADYGNSECEGGWEESGPGCPPDYWSIISDVGGWADYPCNTMYRYYGPYEAWQGFISRSYVTDTRREFSAYICNETERREIEIPQKLQDFLDIQFAEAVDAYPPVYNFNGYNYQHNGKIYNALGASDLNNKYIPPSNGNPGYSIDISKGLWTDGYFEGYTPEVFKLIQYRINFTQRSIKEFTNKKQVMPYVSSENDGYGHILRYHKDQTGDVVYPYASYLYNSSTKFEYATISANSEPKWNMYYPVWLGEKPKKINSATLRLYASRKSANGSANDYGPDYKNYGRIDALGVVWDWGDPGYCRSMCLELGFTAQDLTVQLPPPVQ